MVLSLQIRNQSGFISTWLAQENKDNHDLIWRVVLVSKSLQSESFLLHKSVKFQLVVWTAISRINCLGLFTTFFKTFRRCFKSLNSIIFRAFHAGISVTRLGNFWKFMETNLLTKVAQKHWWLFGLFWKGSLYVKIAVTSIRATLENIWVTLENIWTTFLLQYLVTLETKKKSN